MLNNSVCISDIDGNLFPHYLFIFDYYVILLVDWNFFLSVEGYDSK